MKILVTGANGYLGQGVVKQLLNEGVEVIAADYESSYIDTRAKIKECNLFEVNSPYDFFEQPDAVLHMAWRDGFIHNSSSHVEDIPKHYKFIKQLVDDGIKKVAFMGSMHEVGFYEGSINENTTTHPMSLYGIAKDSMRNMVKLLCETAQVTYQWLRGYYIVGNSECGCSIFSKITTAEREGKETFPFTTGQNQWDFIDYDNFCEQVAATVEQSEINGIINICSGRPEKLADRVERFIQENHYKIVLDYGKFPDRPYDSKAVWGDDSKVKKIMSKHEVL